jgi:hypothetical protein
VQDRSPNGAVEGSKSFAGPRSDSDRHTG